MGKVRMEKLRIAICDDEEAALGIVSSAVGNTLKKHKISVEIHSFLRADRLVEQIKEKGNAYHIIMLDIRMPQIDGVDLAKEIKKIYPDVKIVFISNEEARVFDAFSVNAFFFIRKSKLIEDITTFCEMYIQEMKKKTDKKVLTFHQNGAAISFYPDEIIYIESESRKQNVFINGREEPLSLSASMRAIEEEIQGCGFIRIHKGYLVNNLYISRISGEALVLKNGKSLPISRRKLKEVHAEHIKLTKLNNTMLR